MSFKGDKWIALLLLFFSSVFFIWYAWSSPGVYQGGDTFQHYLIARYAFDHPQLFLDHWGKPVFTALYALPARGGYQMAELTTALIGLSTAWLTFLTAKRLHMKQSWSVIVLVLFTPIYFVHLNSVMTEILFAFWLIAGIYWILAGRLIWSAVFLSFLPFVRTEGFIILPCIGVFFLLQKAWKPFLLLASGFLFFSLVGGILYYKDVLWVFSRNPYAVQSPYGSGDVFHFITSNKVTWGIPMAIGLGMSLVIFSVQALRKRVFETNQKWWSLIIVPFLVFLVFHSLAWATGSLASNGELRVMACTAPLSALLVCALLTRIEWTKKLEILRNASWLLFLAVVILTPFQLFKTPMPKSAAQEMIESACTYVKSNFTDRRVHFVDPHIPVALDRDPYDPAQLVQWFGDRQHPEIQMKPGDLAIWDAHFAAHEGGVDFSVFDESSSFKRVAVFKPENSHIIFGDEEYFVAIFEYIRQP